MKDTFDRSREVEVRRFELATARTIATELRPRVTELLAEARTVLRDVVESCDEAAEQASSGEALSWSMLPFERAVDAAVACTRSSAGGVLEIAALAQVELSQRARRIEQIPVADGADALIVEADSSLRRIRKALSAVETSIAQLHGVAPLLTFTAEIEVALATRRAYSKLRRRILEGGEPGTATLRARFRAAGTQIAVLTGRPIYPELRVKDRLLLRDLQARLLAWLRVESAAADGLRLWQDLAAFLEMLSLVNRRQELISHDAEALGRLGAALARGETSDSVWSTLLALEGLDAELDALLARGRSAALTGCSAVLERIAVADCQRTVTADSEALL